MTKAKAKEATLHVIFNADDFGLTRGVNLGIVDACRYGVVRSTTLMVGMSAEEDAVLLASQTPELKVGLHVRLTAGRSLTSAESLVDAAGKFITKEEFWRTQEFDRQALEAEVVAQVERFLSLGIHLSHLDSHHHVHLHPAVLPVFQTIARDYGVPLRGAVPCLDRYRRGRYAFDDGFYSDGVSLENVLAIVDKHKEDCDVLEIMTHPAFIDAPLLAASAYDCARASELAVLTAPELKAQLALRGVTIADYSILSDW